MEQSELHEERRVVEQLYQRFDAVRADTAERLQRVQHERVGGNHQSRSERDAYAQLYSDYLEQLSEVNERLVFGRLVLDGDGNDNEVRYIGRLGLRDEDQNSVLVDWRASQAAAFYQATAKARMGVRVRRHLTLSGRRVVRLDDEVLDSEYLAESGAAENLRGDGALLAALATKRSGRMNEIVSTIQAEQDRIIRSDRRGALVVQGGPGTGKTAVALHRAAYLLFTHRARLASSGVLVVGPSSVFMNYISGVLPSLGETGVVLQSLGELFPGVTATSDDPPHVALVKGSMEMADLLARAVRSRQKTLASPQQVRVGDDLLVVQPELIAAARSAAQQTRKPHNRARVTFVLHALDSLTVALADQVRAAGRILDDDDLVLLREDIRTAHDVRVLLNTAWLPLTPEKLLGDLYSRPEWCAELKPHWSAQKRAALYRRRDVPFTVSDIPLLDEAAELLGEIPALPDRAARERERQYQRDRESAEAVIANMGVEGLVNADQIVGHFAESTQRLTTSERAQNDRTWVYGHVVVDEAQELSPMQWRVLVRRCPMKSFTIVGDIAQASSVGAVTQWSEALTPFFDDAWRREELTVNYRTPGQIARTAERVALRAGLPVSSTRAVREGDWPVEEIAVDISDLQQLADAVVVAVEWDLARESSGTLAIIVPEHLGATALAVITAELKARFPDRMAGGDGPILSPLSVCTDVQAKGLEFDAVVVVLPEIDRALTRREAAGLYVSMTRATTRLTLVGGPAALALTR